MTTTVRSSFVKNALKKYITPIAVLLCTSVVQAAETEMLDVDSREDAIDAIAEIAGRVLAQSERVMSLASAEADATKLEESS